MSGLFQLEKVAFVFPGQGAQHPGMGRALHEASPAARASLERSAEALESELDLLALLFSGSEAELRKTANTQPAIAAVSLAAHAALLEGLAGSLKIEANQIVAGAYAGHSLGEWSALAAAKSLAPTDAVRAVRARGRFMQEAVPEGEGAMAAVMGLPGEVVSRICAEQSTPKAQVAAANFNGPAQTVIAGHSAAIEAVGPLLVEAGARRVQALAVSAPFHCALMAPVQPRLSEVLEALAFAVPRAPVVTNVEARPERDPGRLRKQLIAQVVSPVRFVESVQAMREKGIEHFVELGPGRVLSGLIRRIDRGATCVSVGDPEGVASAVASLVEQLRQAGESAA